MPDHLPRVLLLLLLSSLGLRRRRQVIGLGASMSFHVVGLEFSSSMVIVEIQQGLRRLIGDFSLDDDLVLEIFTDGVGEEDNGPGVQSGLAFTEKLGIEDGVGVLALKVLGVPVVTDREKHLGLRSSFTSQTNAPVSEKRNGNVVLPEPVDDDHVTLFEGNITFGPYHPISPEGRVGILGIIWGLVKMLFVLQSSDDCAWRKHLTWLTSSKPVKPSKIRPIRNARRRSGLYFLPFVWCIT